VAANEAVAPAVPPEQKSPTPQYVAVLLRRGDTMLQQGDVVAARLFYERAAAAGNGEGATSVGKTYDPNFLATIRAQGLKGDIARAIEWYRMASTVLGDKEAGERLKVLTAQSDR
jgi:TPR repeat protein